MIVMVQVADLSHENFKSSHEVVTLSTFKSFWCQVKLWTQTQVTPRSIPHYQCWIENLCNLLSLQYKENKGKFAASNGRLKANSFSASGGLCPLTPWPGAAPLGALPPDPRYRLALPRSPKMPSLWPPLFVTFRGPWWCCLRDPTFSRFDTIPACDTDRQTHGHTIMAITNRDRTGTVSGTVPARSNVDSVRSRNIFCSGAGTC